MKAKDLIRKLKQYSENADVYLDTDDKGNKLFDIGEVTNGKDNYKEFIVIIPIK